MTNLTSVILTKNEENHITDCLKSLTWCNKVLVIDSFSSDRTVEIAEQIGAQVVRRCFINFSDQHNAALKLIHTEWALFVDADERISHGLAEEISTVINHEEYSGYWIPRLNYQMGKLILHSGLYPDYQLRLFKKEKGNYDPVKKVHERIILDGKSGYLKNPLIHISCDSWQDFNDHQAHYAAIKAQEHFEMDVKPSYHYIIGPLLEFLRRYIWLQGFRDGMHGLKLCSIFAWYNFKMYFELGRLWKVRSHTPES